MDHAEWRPVAAVLIDTTFWRTKGLRTSDPEWRG
jgi:hypothetical protein